MNYGSYFNTGLAASYKVISLGAEYRWGTTSYKIDEEKSRLESIRRIPIC